MKTQASGTFEDRYESWPGTPCETWIEWEIAPFYRRWQGWRKILWWLWPVRWAFVIQWHMGPMVTEYSYCLTAQQAAKEMAEFAMSGAKNRTS